MFRNSDRVKPLLRMSTAGRPSSVHAQNRRDCRLHLERLEDRQLLSITVNTLVDEMDGSIVDGDVSLRDAIVAAAPGETIDFSVNGTIRLTLGELNINKNLTINGPGAHLLTIDARGNDPTPDAAQGDGSRVLNIDDGNSVADKSVAISGLTLTGGDVFGDGGAIRNTENLAVTHSTITGNVAYGTLVVDHYYCRYGYGYYCYHYDRSYDHLGGGIWSSGRLTLTGSTISDNSAQGSGGGIYSTRHLTVTGSDISNNSSAAGSGGGILNVGDHPFDVTDSNISGNSAGSSGGGVFGNNLTVTGSNISGNSAQHSGGGIASFGSLAVKATTISGNTAGDIGGGIQSGNLVLSRSSVTENSAASSGGGISSNGDVTITGSTIGNNTAGGAGGGVYATGATFVLDASTVNSNSAGGDGGGLFVGSASPTILNSTVTTNDAVGPGGGIYFANLNASQVAATISYSTVAYNRADINNAYRIFGGGLFTPVGTLRIDHSIVAENYITTSFETRSDLSGFLGVTVDAQWSLIGDNAHSGLVEAPVGSPDAKGNLIGGPTGGPIYPHLGPLARNGSQTMSHALLAGSPAIDAGRPTAMPGESGVPLSDQRGNPFTRVFDGDGTGTARIDIGAYERQSLTDLNLVVDTLVDEYDGDYSSGDFALREAIELAGGSVLTEALITFAPGLTSSGPATLVLTLGELAIGSSMSIRGRGANLLTIDARGNDPTPAEKNGDGSRVFYVYDGDFDDLSNVTISGVKLIGGDVGDYMGGGAILNHENLTITGSTISGNSASAGGGGVYSIYGNLSVEGSTIRDNSAPYGAGGGISSGIGINVGTLSVSNSTISGNTAGFAGGGISGGYVTVIGSTISGNTADYFGGGGIDGLYVTVTRSTISGNTSGYAGGGIHGYEVTVTSSTISGNSAGKVGGGLYSYYGRLNVTDSTISGNSAGHAGGGIYNDYGSLTVTSSTISGNSAELGGGVYSSTQLAGRRTTIVGSTISGNKATTAGGGIYNGFGLTVIEFSTITGNEAPVGAGGGVASYEAGVTRTRVRSSIIAGNVNSDVEIYPGGPNSFQSSGYNLIGIGNALSRFNQAGDQTGITNPGLGPLALGGGSIMTHALLPGSPAIDRGDPAAVAGVGGVPAFDERSVPYIRVFDGDGDGMARIDIGAIELQPIAIPALAGDYNQNGKVDAADYTVWRSTMGSSVAIYSGADGNGNGVIDTADYDIWKSNFGMTTAVAASVEPMAQIAIAGTQPPALPGDSAAMAPAIHTVPRDPSPGRDADAPAAKPARRVPALPSDAVFTVLGQGSPPVSRNALPATTRGAAAADAAITDLLLLTQNWCNRCATTRDSSQVSSQPWRDTGTSREPTFFETSDLPPVSHRPECAINL